jgi:hypothetical protein
VLLGYRRVSLFWHLIDGVLYTSSCRNNVHVPVIAHQATISELCIAEQTLRRPFRSGRHYDHTELIMTIGRIHNLLHAVSGSGIA